MVVMLDFLSNSSTFYKYTSHNVISIYSILGSF